MKSAAIVTILAVFLFTACDRKPPPQGLPVLQRKYLGQTYPSHRSLMFASGIVSTGMYERDLTLSGDGNEIYFSLFTGDWVTVMVVKRIDGIWYQPVVAEFARDSARFFAEPSITLDGKRIFFLSTLPGWKEQDIWMADRLPGGSWSVPVKLPAPVNTPKEEFYPSVAASGNLYFTRRDAETGKTGVYCSRLKEGSFTEPWLLPAPVNDKAMVYNAGISPDEKFLVACVAGFDSLNPERKPTYMIFFNNPDGSWSRGIDLVDKLNLPCREAISISVSADGHFIFFAAANKTLYYKDLAPGWKSSSIHRYRNLPGNGNSDIYWFDYRKIVFRL